MHVNAYTRTVNGHTVEVSSYDRRERAKSGTAAEKTGQTGGSTGGKTNILTGQGRSSLPSTPNTNVPAVANAKVVAADLREANPDSRLHTDLAEPPPFVKEYLKLSPPATWENMVLALEQADLGPNRVFAYANTFAAEGGVRKDPEGVASSGITGHLLSDARGAAPPGSPLKSVRAPVDLTPDQRVQVYDYYFDNALASVGGAIALDEIPDKQVAAAVADTLFRHGPTGGTLIVQQAINTVRWAEDLAGINLTSSFGDQTLTSLVLLSSSATKAALLTAIAGFRDNRVRPSELRRVEYFSTWK